MAEDRRRFVGSLHTVGGNRLRLRQGVVQAVDAVTDPGNDLADIQRGTTGALRQLAHLVGDHTEATPLLTGPGCLDCRIQRQQVGLTSDIADDGNDFLDAAHLLTQAGKLLCRSADHVGQGVHLISHLLHPLTTAPYLITRLDTGAGQPQRLAGGESRTLGHGLDLVTRTAGQARLPVGGSHCFGKARDQSAGSPHQVPRQAAHALHRADLVVQHTAQPGHRRPMADRCPRCVAQQQAQLVQRGNTLLLPAYQAEQPDCQTGQQQRQPQPAPAQGVHAQQQTRRAGPEQDKCALQVVFHHPSLHKPAAQVGTAGMVSAPPPDSGMAEPSLPAKQEVGQCRQQYQCAEHIPYEHEGEQDTHVCLELDR